MLTAASNALLRALLAPACAACDRPLDVPLAGPVCGPCWRALPVIAPPTCVRCGDSLPAWRAADPLCPRCRRNASPLALARSAGQYDGTLREMIHALKYRRRRMIAPLLAARMREYGRDVLAGADAVVPVPLHPLRLWQRGFNQADDLARGLGLPVWRALRRQRAGPPQASLPAARRHANARGAYTLCRLEQIRPRQWRRLQGATIVLVDDVMTTGATLHACARVLQSAGARSVRALTAARAAAARPLQSLPTPRPSPARR